MKRCHRVTAVHYLTQLLRVKDGQHSTHNKFKDIIKLSFTNRSNSPATSHNLVTMHPTMSYISAIRSKPRVINLHSTSKGHCQKQTNVDN